MPKDTIYRRVPGSGRGGNSLWLGKDHLLSVHYKVFSQEYRRYYYKDIQAIITCKNDSFKIVNSILAMVSGILILLAFFLGDVGTIFTSVFGGLFFLGLLIYLGWGPDCVCYIKTAVQIEKLSPLSRLRRVKKAMAIIHPIIQAVQGELHPEMLEQHMAASSSVPELTIPRYSPAIPSQKVVHEPGYWHKTMYLLMIFLGIYSLILINIRNVPMIAGETFLTLAFWVLAIIGLVKQQNSDLPKGIRNIGWAVLFYMCFEFITSTISYMVIIFKNINNPHFTGDYLTMMRNWADMSPLENPYLMVNYMISIAVLFGLGVYGLILIREFQMSHEK